MVEFKIKKVATADTTLHASYPDLYDGTAPYLKVGGNDEPKKSLVRFEIADKPSYGNAELKGGEIGLYTTGLSASQGSFPTFNIYKLKTGPQDADAWSGDGRIRTVPRGKQIVGITHTSGGSETGSYVKVLNHGLNTGDRIYHSPFTNQYKDVLLAGITPELEYYAIRIDRDNFAFATSITNALADTRVTLVAYSSNNYVPTDTTGEGPWGYIRAETYKQDIHVVSAKPTGYETISENFNGSPYRESDLDFESVQRTVIRKTDPYVTTGDALWDAPEGTERAQGEEGAWRIESDWAIKRWYGEKQSDDTYKIYLDDYESNSDGTGWYQTRKDAGKWKGGYEYVPKTIPPNSLSPNTNIQYNEETLVGSEPYGDEVTPANTMFHIVKGASEFTSAPTSGEGENVLDATGAVRFSTECKKTGGQACNMYSFWKTTATHVKYSHNQQESFLCYKGLPMPTVNYGNVDYGAFGHGKFPLTQDAANAHTNLGAQDWTLSLKVNFKKLEKAFVKGVDANHDTITARRGFHVVLATSPPLADETFYDYCYRLSDDGSWNSSGTDPADHDGIAVSFVNVSSATNSGEEDSSAIKILPLDKSAFANDLINTGDKDITWTNEDHEAHNEGGESMLTMMNEGEWYDIKFVIPTASTNRAMLVVENEDGQNVTDYDATYVEEDAVGLELENFGASGGSETARTGLWYGRDGDGGSALNQDKWWQHLSIWCTNTISDFDATASGEGNDWMANYEDRDTESNIFIDSVSVYGVNLNHTNATIGTGKPRGRISITGSETHESSFQYGNISASRFNKKGINSITKRSDNIVLLGFEDPSQISSAYDIEPSWRYIFWNGYQSANLGADGKTTWTADGTLPATSGIDSSRQPSDADEWFNAVGSSATGASYKNFTLMNFDGLWSLGGAADGTDGTNPHLALYADAGMPLAYSEYTSRINPTAYAFYSDGHHTSGATFSDEVITTRNLFFNKTFSLNDATDLDDTTEGLYGSEQPMASMCPSLGVVVAPSATAISSNTLTTENGPFGGDGHFWKTGQKVCYFNNGNTSITGLTSASGDFTDTPQAYYIVRVSDSGDSNRKFKLSSSEAGAHAGTSIVSISDAPSGNHVIYDWDYYNNRKYFIDGWSSKGLMRLLLQPTHLTAASSGTTTNAIVDEYLDTDEVGYMHWEWGDERFEHGSTAVGHTISNTEAFLTKRENMACAAKVLEVIDRTSSQVTGTITLRVDTTEPLNSIPGTTYRAFLVGESGDGSYKSGLSISVLSKESIQISNWNGKSESGSNMLDIIGTSAARATELSRLWIGPEKYWVGFMIRNQTGLSSTSIETLPNKMYESVCIVAPSGGERTNYTTQGQGQSALYPAWGTPGATYRESTYNADKVSGIRGAYINNWSPSPNMDPTQTIYDLQDFGHGGAKEDASENDLENNVSGGYAAKFIPRTGQINKINIPKLFNTGEAKKEGDTIDLAIQAESASNPSVLSISSIDNGTLPKPFMLTVFEDAKPANPTDFKVVPYDKDPFYPEFKWSASDSDLWYGFIIIDDRPINNQYHHSLLHVPLDEDLRTVASSYDNTKGHYYAETSSPVIYGHRYENTSVYPSGVHSSDALASAGTAAINAVGVKLYDNEEGLAGNTKMFNDSDGTYAQFNFNTTPGSSDFSYPVDEMSVVVHITPTSWGANRYICAFNEPSDTTTTKDSWGIYLDANGQINAFVSASPGTTHQTTYAELKSTTKAPIDGTPTAIILTVDTQLHSGNVKLYINGKLEDQTGLRGTVSTNNWPTDADSLGGEAIFYDTNGSEDLFIGAKSQNSSAGQNSFEGKIEEFVWYDKCIYPVTPQNGSFVLEKPLEELASGSTSASSKSYVARLFIKDYHNIRGKTTGEVAASSQISFKKAAFELYT